MAKTIRALFFCLASAGATAGDWTAYQGGPEIKGIVPDFPPPLEVAWQADLGTNNYSSPVISGGRLFVAGEDGTLRALDLASGREAWKVQLKGKVYGSTPSVADGTLYLGAVAGNGARSGILYAIRVSDGSVRWTFTPPGDIYASPLVAGNLVIVGCDDTRVYGVSRETGVPVWRFTTGNKVHDNSAALAGETVFVGSFDGYMYALKVGTGDLLWRFKTRKRVNTAPVAVDGQVFFGAEDGNMYALSAADGSVAWSFKTKKAVVGGAVVAPDAVYFGSTDGSLYALTRGGALRWSFKAGANVVAAPLLAGRYVYTAPIDTLAILDQDLYALSAESGKVEWKHRLKGPLFSSFAWADGLLVVSGKSGKLCVFKRKAGR